MIGLNARRLDLDRYRALLAMFWGFYAPVEQALGQIEWRGSGLDLEARIKLPWLRDDLLALGSSPGKVAALPQAAFTPSLDGLDEGLGALYVLEGSTLGGQTIVPVVHEAIGATPRSGARFFSSYGPEVGRMWRDYIAVLECAGADSQSAARIQQAALSTFDSLIAWADLCCGTLEPHERSRHVG